MSEQNNTIAEWLVPVLAVPITILLCVLGIVAATYDYHVQALNKTESNIRYIQVPVYFTNVVMVIVPTNSIPLSKLNVKANP